MARSIKELERIVEAVESEGSLSKAAVELGMSRSSVDRAVKTYARRVAKGDTGVSSAPKVDEDAQRIERDTNADGTIDMICKGGTIRTFEDAIKHGDIDMTRFRIGAKSKVSSYEVTLKITTSEKQADNSWLKVETPKQVTNWCVRLHLEPIAEVATMDGIALLHENLSKMPKTKYMIKGLKTHGTYGTPVVSAIMGLVDCHYGKLCHAKEVGHDYDLKIACDLYGKASVKLVDYAMNSFDLEEIIFPIGHDFFHFDNLQGETSNGTPVAGGDTRLPKIFAAGVQSVKNAVEYAARHVPRVRLLWVPGNHDRMTSYHLCYALKCLFEGTALEDVVDVDSSPTRRKYIEIGKNLIGMDHGETCKHDKYPLLMATEASEAWARCPYREFLVGHIHRRKEVKYTVGDTHNGVGVRSLQALTGTDGWHYDHGFVQQRRAAEVLFYDHEYGYRGDMVISVDELIAED